jgi:hypothetical protein
MHPFGRSNPAIPDNPDSQFVQKTRGQKSLYWIDAPGHLYYLDSPSDAEKIDSLNQKQNFNSNVCNRANICTSANWFLKLVIDPGGELDTAASQAGLGSIPF